MKFLSLSKVLWKGIICIYQYLAISDFLWGDTPLYGFIAICLFIHQVDIWVVLWMEDTSALESLEPEKIA